MAVRLTVVCLALAALWLSGQAAWSHGDAVARLARVDERLALDPFDADLLVRHAGLEWERGHVERALADLDRAGHLVPDRHDLELLRGRILLDAGRPAEAEACLRGFLSHEPAHARALAAHGRALAALGRYEEAAGAFGRAIEHEMPPVPEPYLARARMLAAADDGDPTRALAVLHEAREVFGPLVALESEALELEVRAGRFNAALLRLEGLAARGGRRESWLVRRGEILERAGRGEEARQAYQAALAESASFEQRRATRAVQRLEERAREGLARLGGAAR